VKDELERIWMEVVITSFVTVLEELKTTTRNLMIAGISGIQSSHANYIYTVFNMHLVEQIHPVVLQLKKFSNVSV
jgi:hypothetical protein